MPKQYPKPGELGDCCVKECDFQGRVTREGYLRPHQRWNKVTNCWVTCSGSNALPKAL